MGLMWPGAARRSAVLLKSQCHGLCRLHHALERHVMLASEAGAVFVLGRRTLTTVGQGRHLDGHLAPWRCYALKAAW